MLTFEYKVDGSSAQYAAIEEAIRTVQFIRNKCLRKWMDERGVGKSDLQCYCALLAREYPFAARLNSQARQASADRAWFAAQGQGPASSPHCPPRVGICENTLRTYLKQYQAGGIEALKVLQFYRPTSDLEAHHDTIGAYFQEHPTTIPEAVKRIEQLTGLKRSPTQVGIFLKKLGLKCLKTSAVPAKCDVQQQETFKKTNWSRV